MELQYWAGKHGSVPEWHKYTPGTYVPDDATDTGQSMYKVFAEDEYSGTEQGFGFMFTKPDYRHSSHMVEIMRYLADNGYNMTRIEYVPS